MNLVILIGRILFALIFIGSGITGHLLNVDDTTAYGESRGVPNARLLVQLSGVLIALGGIGVILGVWADLAALGLSAYCLIAAFWVHHFWTDEGMTQVAEMSGFMKNLAMAGGGIVLFALVGLLGDSIGFSLTGPLFDLHL